MHPKSNLKLPPRNLSDLFKKTQSPTDSLITAIAHLEQFTLAKENISISSITSLMKEDALTEKKLSPLKKNIALIKQCFKLLFSRNAREKHKAQKQHIHNAVRQAIETIKCSHLLIEKLKKGSVTDQEIASSTLSTITRFNAVITHAKGSTSWKKELTHFLDMCSGGSCLEKEFFREHIDLPKSLLNSRYADEEEAPQEKMQSGHTDLLFIQEADALRLKANMLLNASQLQFKISSERLHSIRTAPIDYSLDTDSLVSTLSLTLPLLPGASIKVKGSFKRDPTLKSTTIPLTESFQLDVKSKIIGFPHPSQYTGWGLTDLLIPTVLHHPNRIPDLRDLQARKKNIENDLLPGGLFFKKIHDIFLEKKAILSKYSSYFLQQHKKLIFAILKAADIQYEENAVNAFFEKLAEDPNPFGKLAEIYECINSNFIIQPAIKVEECILANQLELEKIPLDFQALFAEYNKVMQLLSKKVEEPLFKELGLCIGKASAPIILQSHSEVWGTPPPKLSLFEKKIQTAAFRQLYAFLEEIEGKTRIGKEYLETLLKEDIALFDSICLEDSNSKEVELVQQITAYYVTEDPSSRV
jgi:hypothetical protein